MNGRGKPLTDFENFKADLIKYIDDENNEKWFQYNHPETGFANKLDNDWMDLFWEYRNSYIRVDDLFFTFINRYFLVNLMQKYKDLDNSRMDSENQDEQKKRIVFDYLYSYVGEVTIDGSKVIHIPYSKHGFRIYKQLFELLSPEDNGFSLLENFYMMMENLVSWHKKYGKLTFEDSIENPYSQNHHIFNFIYSKELTNKENHTNSSYQLLQTHQIAFWAVCYFFSSDKVTSATQDSLKKWMRIIWNVCSVSNEIQTKQIVITAIFELASYVKSPTDSYSEFRRINISPKKNVYKMSAFERHIREEREKVLHMLWNNGKYYGSVQSFIGKTWEEVIINVECESFLNGNIHCLFDVYTDKDISISWDYFDQRYNNLLLHKNNNFGVNSLKSTLLVSDFRIRENWYHPDSIDLKIVRNWRTTLQKYCKDVTEWLNDYGPVSKTNPFKDYCKDLLINTDLLDLIKHKDGIYLAFNSSTRIRVLMHHQASLPYILFNKKRNEILGRLIIDGTLIGDKSKVYELNDKRLVLNGASINFKYSINGVPYDFSWYASGVIELRDGESSKTVSSSSATCIYSFLNILKSMI